MKKNERVGGSGGADPIPPGRTDGFAADLERRRQAAQGLERDLLTEVPLLYGSPGGVEPHGDPGILLAAIHRDELQRRHGGGVPKGRSSRSDVSLPFKRTITCLAAVFLLLLLLLS